MPARACSCGKEGRETVSERSCRGAHSTEKNKMKKNNRERKRWGGVLGLVGLGVSRNERSLSKSMLEGTTHVGLSWETWEMGARGLLHTHPIGPKMHD